MPKRKERMAGYIRESDPSLADSTTIESQAKLVRQYGEKQGYLYEETRHEYKEAISAYSVPYMQRPRLLDMLRAAERKEFDVLVVSEVRAVSRRQVEVLIIYDMLQKWGIRLETVTERFADDAMGKAVLGLRAMFVEIERDQSFFRMERGKADRIAIGKAPNGHSPAYGYLLVDTKQEVKGRYELNRETVYTDAEGKAWDRIAVCLFIFGLLKKGGSLHGIVTLLNDMGIPTPRGGKLWSAGSLQRIVTNPIYMGESYANRYKQIEKHTSKAGKTVSILVERPKEEWIRLPDAPAIIDRETFEAIQRQLQINKQEALRNNKQTELGLLRAGYIFCGICGKRMHVHYPPLDNKRNETARYECDEHVGGNLGIRYNHRTQIRLPSIEKLAKEKLVEVLLHPEMVRAKVAAIRKENTAAIDDGHVKQTIEDIRVKLRNLYRLAENATDDETMADIAQRMNQLEKQKRDAESLLYDFAEDEEERAALEAELVRFEQWVEEVRPKLANPDYLATEATYEELRLAVRVIGLRVTIYPTTGDWPYRHFIEATVPEVMEKVSIVSTQTGVW